MKRVSIIIISLYLLSIIPVFASENQTDNVLHTYSRADILCVLEKEDIDIPENAYIGLSEYIINETQTILVPSIVLQKELYFQHSYLITLDNKNNLIDFSNLIRSVSSASSGSLSNVYVTGYYYSATDSTGNVTIYRPYKVAFSSNTSQNVLVSYYTYGIRFNLNHVNQTTIDSHTISCSAYPATINLQYDTTYYYNGYIGPGSSENKLRHRIYVFVNGDNKGYVKCAGDWSYVS